MHRTFSTMALAAFGLAIWLMPVPAAHGVTVAELQKELAGGTNKITVIDVRQTPQFNRGHIPGAINVPATVCAQKNLPPLGQVIIYDDGLGRDATDKAAVDLGAKPGITVTILDGGFAAWESAQGLTTRPQGLLKGDAPNYITYEQLKVAKADEIVLVDLRKGKAFNKGGASINSVPADPLTDLTQEFPGVPSTHSAFSLPPVKKISSVGSSAAPLLVLIDDGDGQAQEMAKTLKGNGIKRYAILSGGELILSRHGQRGLQRSGPAAPSSNPASNPKGTAQ